jgi:hypothetical protein
MYKNDQDIIGIITVPFSDKNQIEVHMMDSHRNKNLRNSARAHDDENEIDELEDGYDQKLIENCTSGMDLKEAYLKIIFEPYKFSKLNIIKSLGVSFLK